MLAMPLVATMQGRGTAVLPPPCPLIVPDADIVPAEVCEPDPHVTNDVRFFDAFSWQSFLALVRPAKARGEPDLTPRVGTIDRPLVFETLKASWEVLGDRDAANQPPPPIEWSQKPTITPCGDSSSFEATDLVISSFGELEDLAQAGRGSKDLLGPIVTQNGQYVRYSMGYNRVLFDAIVKKRLDLAANLKNVVLPAGSIAIKAAWMVMTGKEAHPERYYRRHARITVIGGGVGACERKEVALIALHIIQKTPLRPQWVWSTFEHVDNLRTEGRPGPFALHNGDTTMGMPIRSPHDLGHLSTTPAPFNITREVELHTRTVEMNGEYEKALTTRKAVWSHYRLVMTQWPRNKAQPYIDASPPNTIPGTPKTHYTSYANPAIETFFQTPITNGCMSCHDVARPEAGFLWSLRMHAWTGPGNTDLSNTREKTLRQLDELLVRGQRGRARE